MIDEQSRRTAYRVRVLPDQLRRARRRLAHLRIEAKRLGMTEQIAEDDASAKEMP